MKKEDPGDKLGSLFFPWKVVKKYANLLLTWFLR